MILDGFEWMLVLYIPAIFYLNWRQNHGECANNLRATFGDRVRNRLAQWKDRSMKKTTIQYNDPMIIKAIARHDPKLAWVIENWEDFTWLQRKEIYWKTRYYYWRARINDIWPRLCMWFVNR